MSSDVDDEAVAAFARCGFVTLRNVVRGPELDQLRVAVAELVARVPTEDYVLRPGHRTGAPHLCRIEHVADKHDALCHLLGHPNVLAFVDAVLGPGFVPSFDKVI